MNLTKDWITGFVDGEGSFHVGYFPNTNTLRYVRFTVTQNDYDILKNIERYFGFGSIMVKKTGGFNYFVDKTSDLLKIVSFFDGQFRTERKRKQFEIFKKAVFKRDEQIKKRYFQSDEDKLLIEMLNKGFSYKEISIKFGKSINGLKSRRYRLRLNEKAENILNGIFEIVKFVSVLGGKNG